MSLKAVSAVIGILVLAGAGIFIAKQMGAGGATTPQDFAGGVSTAVACEEIAATRGLVNTELAERKATAADTLATEMEAASDNYWEKRRALDETRRQCESEALLADPCKGLFEQMSTLADEILENIDSGFDEAKFQEREGLKKEYDECVKNPPEEDTYPGKMAECIAAFNTGNEAALAERATEEEAAQSTHDGVVAAAEAAHASKMAALDALEKECEETKYERKYGNLPATGIPVTDYQGGSPACTGVFPGRDPDMARTISTLRSQFNQAKAAGNTDGFMGTTQLDAKIKELEAEMAAGPAKCVTDADCGGPTAVCCNIKEIGRAFCDAGICAHEKTACGAEEVCAGKPAQCLSLIQVIEYEDKYLPTNGLRIADPDECGERHWHGTVVSLDGIRFTDPDPDGCGFGAVGDKPTFMVYPPAHSTTPGTSGSGGAVGGGGQIEVRGGIFGE